MRRAWGANRKGEIGGVEPAHFQAAGAAVPGASVDIDGSHGGLCPGRGARLDWRRIALRRVEQGKAGEGGAGWSMVGGIVMPPVIFGCSRVGHQTGGHDRHTVVPRKKTRGAGQATRVRVFGERNRGG